MIDRTLGRALARSTGVLITGCCVFVAPLESQTPRPLRLGAATGTLPEEFTAITSVRELRDGRVLVTDGREQRLVVADFRTGRVEQVGRKGGGPGEYGMVGMVRPLAGDSSIMADLMGRRWLLFDGAQIVGQHSSDHPAVLAAQGFMVDSDALGRVLSRRMPDRRDGVTITDARDSSVLVLVARRTGQADTVARVRNAERRFETVRNAEGRVTRSSMTMAGPLRTEEQAVLFADGWLAVARLEPFRVDWRAPDGTWTRGAPLPVPQIRVDARERAAFLERNASAYAQPTMPGLPASQPPSASDFPATVPPFPMGAVTQGPAGRLLIRRHRSADVGPSHYLVIDRQGALLGEIILPVSETIVGASERTVYVAAKDEDDIQRLRRHVWP